MDAFTHIFHETLNSFFVRIEEARTEEEIQNLAKVFL